MVLALLDRERGGLVREFTEFGQGERLPACGSERLEQRRFSDPRAIRVTILRSRLLASEVRAPGPVEL